MQVPVKEGRRYERITYDRSWHCVYQQCCFEPVFGTVCIPWCIQENGYGAVIFVITISSFVTALIYKFLLLPLNVTYLQTIVFILVIAALVQFVEMFLKKSSPSLYNALGVYLPLITTNCAVLGVALINVQKSYGIVESVVNGLATAVGFTIAIVLMAGIREKTEYNDVPESFKGSPIVLLTACLMAIAFFGFSSLK